MKKWLFTVAVTFLMAVLVLGAGVMEASAAVKAGTTSDGFSYKISKDNTVEITRYKGKKKNLKFPDKIKGKKVTRIGWLAVGYNQYVTSVVIPDTVTTVDADAFKECQNLTTIMLGKNVKEFTWEDEQNERSEYIKIGKKFKAFKVSKKNKVFSAKDGVLFKEKVLVKCPPTKKGTYQVPEGTTGVMLRAFADSELSIVRIPASVGYIGEFYSYEGGSCDSKIASYEVDEDNKSYYAQDGVLFKKDDDFYFPKIRGGILVHYPPEKRDISYRVPESVKMVQDCAFANHKYLEEVETANAYVSEDAFFRCKKLRRAVISNDVDENAFFECETLTEVEFKKTDDVNKIGISSYAFRNCGLRSVTLSENVIFMERLSITGCDSLKWIEIRNKDCEIGGLPDKAVIYGYPGSTAEVYAKKWGNEFKAIGEAKPEIKNPVTASGARIKLSPKTCTYYGKAEEPYVVVKDKSGKEISRFEYQVSYQNNKTPGLGVVKVKFNGYDYKGTIRTTFVIKPPKSTIKKLTPGKKSLTLQWGGVKSSWISGYEIQYSTDSAFEKGNTRNVNVKPNVAKKQIKKLKSGKTYYVRIRSYKTVQRDGKTEKLYSKWSAKKKVKTL